MEREEREREREREGKKREGERERQSYKFGERMERDVQVSVPSFKMFGNSCVSLVGYIAARIGPPKLAAPQLRPGSSLTRMAKNASSC